MHKTEILGVKVDSARRSEVLQKIESLLRTSEKNNEIIATTYSEFVVAAQKDESFKNILNNAFLNLADGIGILWASSFLARQTFDTFEVIREFLASAWQTAFKREKITNAIPERITGADIVWDIAEISAKTGNSVYFLGAYGDVTRPFAEKFPSLKIAGRDESSPNDPDAIGRINASGADILLVAFDPVVQYKWLHSNRSKITVKLSIGLGGTFDYITGKRKRAGEFWQKYGLEWMHRLLTQPWRIRRMWNAIVVFTYLVVRAKIKNV